MADFEYYLERSGLSQARLSRKLGVRAATVNEWTRQGPPRYAIAYLKLYIKVKELWEEVR